MDDIRYHLKTRLNMAKKGWRGDQTFEVHTSARYDVRQRQEQEEKKRKRRDFWKKTPNREED